MVLMLERVGTKTVFCATKKYTNRDFQIVLKTKRALRADIKHEGHKGVGCL